MSNNKINQANLKSVAGGKSQATNAQNVEKAKAIVKEELKKESLTKAAGTGPLPVKVSGGAHGEARPAGATVKEQLGKGSLSKAAGTGPLPVKVSGGAHGEARPAGGTVKEQLGKGSLSKAVGTGPIPVQVSGGAHGEARPMHRPVKLAGSAIGATPPICITPEQIS